MAWRMWSGLSRAIFLRYVGQYRAQDQAALADPRTGAPLFVFNADSARYLPAAAKGHSFPTRPQLFTIKYVGGWTRVETKFFDPKTGVMAKIEGSLGG